MVAGAAGAMHAAGVTLDSLSSRFSDLMNLGSESTTSATSTTSGTESLDPAHRMQALGKSLFEALKKAGWPADKPIELQLDATGQMSTSNLPPELKSLVDQYLQQHPDVVAQFEQLASELKRQYEMPDTSGLGLSNGTANGTWKFSLNEQETKWRWSST